MAVPARGIDHLVVAGPDLDAAARSIAQRLDHEPSPGGQHLGWGTRNVLFDLSGGAYLEVIGPDPHQPDPDGPRPFGIDGLSTTGLVAWAVRTPDIDESIAELGDAGVDLGPVLDMSRTGPDGRAISWRLTPPRAGPLPFLIDWGSSPHPTTSLSPGPSLEQLRIETDDAAGLLGICRLLDVDVDVVTTAAANTRLAARVRIQSRVIELT